VVAVTLQGADEGDTTTIEKTLIEAAEQLEAATDEADEAVEELSEVVADKGYHSNDVLTDLAELELRSYVSEPRRGQRKWGGRRRQRDAVYGNRRRMKGERGKRLMRLRAERVERSFAHCYETGGMRRVHLKGRENVLKRLLIHVGGFNLSLAMRKTVGAGTPRGLAAKKKLLEGLSGGSYAALGRLCATLAVVFGRLRAQGRLSIVAPPLPPLAPAG
jgi:transposase